MAPVIKAYTDQLSGRVNDVGKHRILNHRERTVGSRSGKRSGVCAADQVLHREFAACGGHIDKAAVGQHGKMNAIGRLNVCKFHSGLLPADGAVRFTDDGTQQ